MADIFMWTTAGSVAMFSIVIVYLITHFITPMRNSPAKYFVKAKREGKPLVILDAGKYFKFVVGDKKSGEEKAEIIRDYRGVDVVKAGNIGGMKFGEGVMMGVGEDFRALVGNLACIDLMEMIEAKGWDTAEVKKKLEMIEDNLRKDLGYKDEVKDFQTAYAKARAETAAKYNIRIEQIIKALQEPAGQKQPQKQKMVSVVQEEPDEGEGDADYGAG